MAGYLDDYGDEGEVAELYKTFAQLFMKAPETEELLRLKELFDMTFEETEREVREDFCRLFVEPSTRIPPYESLYRYPLGHSPKLWGTATAEVQSLYRSAGLTIDQAADLVPDHLSAELLFSSYLIENGMSELQRKFLSEHLSLWVPEYCDEIARHAHTMFYREVAKLLKELILSDYGES